jgi:hypothetical protein
LLCSQETDVEEAILSLVRPQASLEGRGEQEQTLETTILSELGSLNHKFEKISEGQEFLKTYICGGEFGGVEHEGKLPEMKAEIQRIRDKYSRLEVRTKSLEDDRIAWQAAARASAKTAAWIGGLVGSVIGTGMMLLVEWIKH